MSKKPNDVKLAKWQQKLHEIIYEADTPAGKFFDVALLWAILLSILGVMLESVDPIRLKYGKALEYVEWGFTIFFTVEYILRIISIGKPFRYIFSFYGIVDFLSIIPTYMGLFVSGVQSLRVLRTIRLLRVFRIFKLGRYLGAGKTLVDALKASRPKIIVFLFGVMTVVIIMGTVMYLIEDYEGTKFTSIPRSIYWAIVTLTTVGYGDISPETVLGQTLASIIMILGYSIIAVPTGIVSAEIANAEQAEAISTQSCPQCSAEGHDKDAIHCKYCGGQLNV